MLTIIFEHAPEGGYTAAIPEFPGVHSEGETIEEAKEMVLDALREVMAFRRDLAKREATKSSVIESVAVNF